MVTSSAGLGPESDHSGSAQKQMYEKFETHPLVREGTPHQEIWSSTPRQTGRRSQHIFNFNFIFIAVVLFILSAVRILFRNEKLV
jgi:hypothetical protein